MLNKYYGFLLESVLLSTNEFSKVLNSLGDDPIAIKIKELLGQDIETKYNYLDVSDEEGKVSFVPDDKYQKGILRPSTALVGRLIRGILSDNKIEFTDSQIEDFVNKYKSKIKIQKELDISVVDGEDIRYWYDEQNHHPSAQGNSSSLANSCMRFERCSKYFDIYVDNPETIKMIIYLEDGLLKARALLWKTNEGWYMDRVYSSERSLENLLLEWAKREYDVKYSFMESVVKKLEVQVSDSYYMRYPYMDTFKYLDKEVDTLMNYVPSTNTYIVLEDTHGGFSEPEMVWSNYSRRYIPESDAIWVARYSDFYNISDVLWSHYYKSYIPASESIFSEEAGTHILKEDSCEVETLDGKMVVLPKDHDSVVYVEETGEYKHIDLCVWSDFERKYIDEEFSTKVTYFKTKDIFNSELNHVSILLLKSLKAARLSSTDSYEDYDYMTEDLYLESLYINSSYEKLISIANKITSSELKLNYIEEIQKADQMLMFKENYYKTNYDKLITEDIMKSSWLKVIKGNKKISDFVNKSGDKDILMNPYDHIKMSKVPPRDLLDLSRKISLMLELESGNMEKIFYIAVQSMVNYISTGEKFSL